MNIVLAHKPNCARARRSTHTEENAATTAKIKITWKRGVALYRPANASPAGGGGGGGGTCCCWGGGGGGGGVCAAARGTIASCLLHPRSCLFF
jgi:hypothetical protein